MISLPSTMLFPGSLKVSVRQLFLTSSDRAKWEYFWSGLSLYHRISTAFNWKRQRSFQNADATHDISFPSRLRLMMLHVWLLYYSVLAFQVIEFCYICSRWGFIIWRFSLLLFLIIIIDVKLLTLVFFCTFYTLLCLTNYAYDETLLCWFTVETY